MRKPSRSPPRRQASSSEKAAKAQNRIIVIESADLPTAKTKDFVGLLDKLGVAAERKVLVLVDGKADNIVLASRNVTNVLTLPVNNINIFDLLTSDYVVATSDAIRRVEEVLG